MDEGLIIPIGADLGEMQEAFKLINANVAKMGSSIQASLARSNAVLAQTGARGTAVGRAFAAIWPRIRAGSAAAFSAMLAAARRASAAILQTLQSVGSAAGRLGSTLGKALSVAGLASGIGSIGGAITLAVKSIGEAAQMETLETAFAPLLGGAQAAKARIAELAAFAASTPFEMPEVAKASRVLETLTKGALSTGRGLTLVGNVAAATAQPFDELAMWIGRLYDGLQSGRPVGEALARLQELGVVSGDVRGRIEALQKTGAAGEEVWTVAAAALGRFSGSMERQSVTWAGRMSTFRDTIAMTMAEFGKPIMDGLKPFLDMAIARVESLKTSAVKMGESIKYAFNFALAAIKTGSVGKVLQGELTLAFLTGINVLFAGLENSMRFLSDSMQGIMRAFGAGLRASGLADIFRFLAEGFAKMITAGINDALGNIPGLGDLKKIADYQSQVANISFSAAAELTPFMDIGAGFRAFGEELKNTVAKVKSDFSDAMQDPLIDTSFIESEVNGVRSSLDSWIRQFEATNEQARKALDDKLKTAAPTAPQDLQQAVNRGARPAVSSLARVGGGGFAGTVMNQLFGETRRQTTVLREIAKNTGRPIAAIA